MNYFGLLELSLPFSCFVWSHSRMNVTRGKSCNTLELGKEKYCRKVCWDLFYITQLWTIGSSTGRRKGAVENKLSFWNMSSPNIMFYGLSGWVIRTCTGRRRCPLQGSRHRKKKFIKTLDLWEDLWVVERSTGHKKVLYNGSRLSEIFGLGLDIRKESMDHRKFDGP